MPTASTHSPTAIRISADAAGDVSGLLLLPEGAHALLVLGHGAGAGMRHRFMEGVAQRLAGRGVATLRYQFPDMEAGKSRPDRAPVLVRTARAALRRGGELAEGLPLFAGGKSLGGRMTSTAAAEVGWGRTSCGTEREHDVGASVRGIVFFGFPLHRPGGPSAERAAHLADVPVPMLFLQGTRDALAKLDVLGPVLTSLGGLATLHVVEGADHGFHLLKSSPRSDEQALDEMADQTDAWIRRVLGV